MELKHYYLVDRSIWEKFPKEQFAHSHCIPTDAEGKLLMVAEFPNEAACDFWETIPGVETLPHLIFGRDPVKSEHIALLSKTIGAVVGDDTLMVAQKAGKIHPMFRPERV